VEKILRLILSYWFIGVEGDADPATDTAAADDAATDASADDLPDDDADGADGADDEPAKGDEAGGQPQQGRAAREIAKLRQRSQDAERRLRETEERLSRATPAPTQPVDEQFQREEARLRDPAVSDLEKWQIQSNRTIREARQAAAMAQINALDTADRTDFQAKSLDNPRMRKYADRVEQRLAEIRKTGGNAPRAGIYLFLLGEDVDKAAKAKPPAKPAARPGALPDAQRGRPAGARSDVNARGTQSEHEKRRARLEGRNI
jgi:hypothetical protein